MTPISRTPIAVLAAAAAGLALCGSAAAAAAPLVAPGRVAFSVNAGAVSPNADGGFAALVAALPGGGSLMLGTGSNQAQVQLAQLTATGALEPTFGNGGIAHVTLPVALGPIRLLRTADGRFLVVGVEQSSSVLVPGVLGVARINPDGSLDTTFGAGGVVTTPVQDAGFRGAVALDPAGNLLLAGSTGHQSNAIAHDPFAPGLFQWVVARLTPAGALDPSFGQGGIVTVAGGAPDMRGLGVTALADGSVVTLGQVRVGTTEPPVYANLLTRLTPAGLVDPGFGGGLPLTLPAGTQGSDLLALPGGGVVVASGKTLVRVTPAGVLDPTFGSGGVATLGVTLPFPLELFPGADGSVLAVGASAGSANGVTGLRVTALGTVDASLGGPTGATYVPPFGGGESSFLVSVNPRPLPSLSQDSFRAADVAQRADGSLIAAGGVSVIQPLGEGVGNSVFDFAAAALTPAFKPLTSFGGPAAPLSLRLGVPGQRATTAHTRHGVRVLVNLSSPGLARAYVRAGSRVLAQSVLPVFSAGARILPVELTHAGAVYLRTHRGVHVSVSVSARDLLAGAVSATAHGVLK